MRYLLSTLGWLALMLVGLPAIVVALLPPRLSTDHGEGRAWAQVTILCDAVALYTLHIGQPPADLEALRAAPDDLPGEASWQGPYLDKPIPVDPWGNDFRYQAGGRGPGTTRIWSCGRDGISGTTDDVTSDVFENAPPTAGSPTWNPLRR